MSISRRFTCKVEPGEEFGAIALPFDPREVFGKARAPVIVTIGTHSYRSTVFNMGGPHFVPLRKSNREAAGVIAGSEIEVELTLDEAPRTIETPDDLAAAIDAVPGGRAVWEALSFTSQREHVEAVEHAKKPETRQRRIARAVEMVEARLAKETGSIRQD